MTTSVITLHSGKITKKNLQLLVETQQGHGEPSKIFSEIMQSQKSHLTRKNLTIALFMINFALLGMQFSW
jgi:hypothetical protein